MVAELPATTTETEELDTRRAFVDRWVRASAARVPVDRKCLTHQVNAWSLDLSKPDWVARRYGRAAAVCAGAPPTSELTGWRRVRNLYGDFADPLARYVVSYYYATWALRPAGIPNKLRDPFREQARSTACTAVHLRLVRGSAAEPGVLGTEQVATSFVTQVAADAVEHRGAHRQSAVLAFADGVLDQARMLDRDHVAVADRCGLPFDAVEPLIARLIDSADRLIAEYDLDLPTAPQASARTEDLLRFVDKEYEDVVAAIRRHTLAGVPPPVQLERRSEHLAEARARTHRALLRAIRRGCAMTDEDARRMFYARLGWLLRGEAKMKSHRQFGDHAAADTADHGTARDELLTALRTCLIRHRAEIPLGIGAAAEYDLVLRLLGLPGLEAELLIGDTAALTAWCAAAWAQQRPDHALAMDPAAAADVLLHAVRWAVEQSRGGA
ncbi:hypothetical protein [Nocardia brasiliensis]|uniref:hypothetical protein n=1 Tax=Nocardia brasiliensis TaxID=37326 RepID=UPI001895BC35|nr:hypothetical protein [Nocardia brasiliensis]MBF6548646.1 hypothetical protein [Nocardia brasiliensis]